VPQLSSSLPDPLPRILLPLLADLAATLGPDLLGVYLYGSAVAGGFEPDASDLDLAIVVGSEVDAIDRGAFDGLIERLAAREPEWADRLDLVFVGQATLAAFREGGPLLSISHDEPLRRYDDADDWLPTWFLVRGGRTIAGPPVESLVPPITLAEFTAAVANDGDRLLAGLAGEARPGVVAYTVLTVARVACLLATHRVVPKQDAAAWLAVRDPGARETLEACLRVRASGGRNAFTLAESRAAIELAERLGAQIRLERPTRG
jgi:hypothetical protein